MFVWVFVCLPFEKQLFAFIPSQTAEVSQVNMLISSVFLLYFGRLDAESVHFFFFSPSVLTCTSEAAL